jgi:hypothetical protein
MATSQGTSKATPLTVSLPGKVFKYDVCHEIMAHVLTGCNNFSAYHNPSSSPAIACARIVADGNWY